MFQVSKTRAAEYANLYSVHHTGFTGPADPITCLSEPMAVFRDAEGPIVELMGQQAVDAANEATAAAG